MPGRKLTVFAKRDSHELRHYNAPLIIMDFYLRRKKRHRRHRCFHQRDRASDDTLF